MHITFTIATVTYNAADTLTATLRSILAQTHTGIEFLLIDGASSDDTLRIFHEHEARLRTHCQGGVTMQSEQDNGLYDAMNKALKLATGNYLIFLNAGDCLHAPNTLQQVSQLLQSQEHMPDILYGQTDIVDANGKYLRPRHYLAPEQLTQESFLRGMLVCHQAFWPSVSLCKTIPYDTRYRYSADYDWCIRCLQESTHNLKNLSSLNSFNALSTFKICQTLNTHQTLINYLDEGLTTRNHRASLIERFHVMRRHYGLLRTLLSHARMLCSSISR